MVLISTLIFRDQCGNRVFRRQKLPDSQDLYISSSLFCRLLFGNPFINWFIKFFIHVMKYTIWIVWFTMQYRISSNCFLSCFRVTEMRGLCYHINQKPMSSDNFWCSKINLHHGLKALKRLKRSHLDNHLNLHRYSWELRMGCYTLLGLEN